MHGTGPAVGSAVTGESVGFWLGLAAIGLVLGDGVGPGDGSAVTGLRLGLVVGADVTGFLVGDVEGSDVTPGFAGLI